MNETTKILQELIEDWDDNPPLSRHQIPRGVTTLEDMAEFAFKGAMQTDNPRHKVAYFRDVILNLSRAIAVYDGKLLDEVYSTDPEINEFFSHETKTSEGLQDEPIAETTNSSQLKYGEKVPERNQHTDATDKLTKELDKMMPASKNARRR